MEKIDEAPGVEAQGDLYDHYVRFTEENRDDIMGLMQYLQTSDLIEPLKESFMPLSREELNKGIAMLPPSQRAEFEDRMRKGYKHAKKTWAKELGKEIAERIEKIMEGEE